jgi:hypothetical protein
MLLRVARDEGFSNEVLVDVISLEINSLIDVENEEDVEGEVGKDISEEGSCELESESEVEAIGPAQLENRNVTNTKEMSFIFMINNIASSLQWQA